MKRTATQIILMLVHVCFTANVASAADGGLGVWTNNDETHTYAFLKNNELKFWGQASSWDQYTKRTTLFPGKSDGAWRTGDALCWMGDKKQQVGNLMVYADTLQCCMSAQFLGSKLVLSEVWQKGEDNLGICTNRVLKRARETPDQRDARLKAEHERVQEKWAQEQAKKDQDTAQRKIEDPQDSRDGPKELSEADGAMLRRHQEAEKECPDAYRRYKEMERKYGQPQLWQGCGGAYY